MVCKVCGGENIKENIFSWNTIQYDKCECGIVFKHDMTLESHYTNDDSYRDYMFREAQMYEDFESKILYLKRIKKSGSLLDVGCNYGLLMNVAKDYGYEVNGIEPSLSCVRYGKERFGFNIIWGVLEEPTKQKYDIITFNHVLEHTIDPIKVLRAANLSLNEDGIVLIAFPNFGCEEAQKNPTTWPTLCPHTHNWQFTLETASAVLMAAGFDVISNPELTGNLVLIGRKAQVGAYPVVDIKRHERDHVDIILPIYNGDYTKTFVKELYETADYPFKLYIIDDCSNDGIADYIKTEVLPKHKEIVYIRNEENLGFLKTVNVGIRASENDFVLIANNDLRFLRKGWLSTTVNTLKNNKDIGAVGIEYLHSDVDFVTMCYFMTKRSILDRIGYLDESFAPGVFEDVEFCTRLQLMGYGCVAIDIPVAHLNNNGPQQNITKEKLTEINRQKFLAKYNFVHRDFKIVFHMNNQLWVGGIEEVIKNLIKYKDEGYEVIVASPQDGRMAKEMRDYGATVFIGNFTKIYNLINIIKPDIIHTHTSGLLTYGNHLANLIVPKPIRVETIHSPGTNNATEDKLDALVSVSNDTFLRQNFSRTVEILNGVDFDKCKREEIGKPKETNKIVIGKTCRMAKDKKVLDFILAAYYLTEKYKNTKYNLEFHLVGDDSTKIYRDKCVLFAKQLGLGNLFFYPETRETSFMNGWDIGLAPTWSEGFGISTAEMVAFGLPVVTYNCFANPEIVLDGINGFLVDVDDINGLVEKTSNLIENKELRLQMGENGLSHIQNFDARNMSKEYYDLYNKLLGEKVG